MIKNVLIPTDFSENANNAISYAIEYFEGVSVNFYLLHVSSKSNDDKQEDYAFASMTLDHPSSSVIQSSVEQLLSQIITYKQRSKTKAHNFFAIHENSLMVEAIRKHVSEKQIDYILMGTRGASSMDGVGIGSNTAEVITKVKCPMLVIPKRAQFKGIHNIAFPTDYNCIYRNIVVSTISDTLSMQKAALRVLHIKARSRELTSSQTDNKVFLQEFISDTRHSFHFLELINLESGLQAFVETWDINMIAIAAKNLNFMQKILLSPSVTSIPYHSEIPFLILHE